MSALEPTGVAGFLAHYEGLRARLPGDPTARAAAAELFRTLGLPGRRDEAWKYTNLRPLAEAAFHEPLSPVADHQVAEGIPRLAGSRLLFIDGRYRPDLSAPPAFFTAFADRPLLADLSDRAEQRMIALNTMLAEDGAVLDIPAGHEAGAVQIATIAAAAPGRATGVHPRHVVRLGAGARLVLILSNAGEGTYLHNEVADIVLAEGAHLTLLRVQDESRAAFHIATGVADIAAGATLDSFVLTLGGRMVRTEIHACLAGARAEAHLSAAQLLSGVQHADATTVVRHNAPECASRQTVKHVLTGRSRGVFQGRIEVARGAQKTDGYQMSQALLLSPDAEIDTKPELEIFADDVKCSHGATVGELDAEQMFYLRSRGVPEADARAILIRAFLAEALDAVPHEPTRAAMEAMIDAWWRKEAA
ncbi:MAG TPA: Fe-S cluster assembly protein SufD [Acetobacteraceae bacterium]|nr:Fe-S cluster assembly protein SufD [Acetobacteraceae bacterium]